MLIKLSFIKYKSRKLLLCNIFNQGKDNFIIFLSKIKWQTIVVLELFTH